MIFNVFSTCVVQEQFVLAIVKCIFSFSSIVLCPHVSILLHDSENSFQHQYFLGVVLNIVTTVTCSTHRGGETVSTCSVIVFKMILEYKNVINLVVLTVSVLCVVCSGQLGMEDEDVIEVYQEQTGGLWND